MNDSKISGEESQGWLKPLLVVLCLWYAFSYIFLKNPQLLHAKQTKLRLAGKPKYSQSTNNGGPGHCSKYLLAHRGGSCDGPENTLECFKKAAQNGIDMIECDVRITKDKQIVVFHDADFKRTCGDARTVLETNYADLPALKRNIPVHFLEHECCERAPNCCAKITLLEDIFKTLDKDQLIQIEVKDQHNEEATRLTVALVQKYNRQSTTILGSLHRDYNELIRQLDPTIPTFCSWADVGRLQIGFLLGLMPFMSVPFESLSCPYLTADLLRMKRQEFSAASSLMGKVVKVVEVVFMMIIKLEADYIFAHMNERGVLTNLWVINDDEDVETLLNNSCVAGIMTDRATRVKSKMIAHESKFSKTKSN